MEPFMTHAQAAAKLFPLLFNMMGPIGIIPLFARLTGGIDGRTRVAVARRAAGLSFLSLLIAVFLGAAMVEAWGIQRGSLILAAGLIVTLTALAPLLWSGGGAPPPPHFPEVHPRQIAASPLAFPGIVTPRAVGVLIIFVAFFPSLPGKLTVLAVAAFVLLLNLLAMLYAHVFMEKIGMTPLLVLGAVFGVLQVVLGVQMMANGWTMFAA